MFCGLDEKQTGKMIQLINRKEQVKLDFFLLDLAWVEGGGGVFLWIYESQARSYKGFTQHYVRTVLTRGKFEWNEE